MTQNKTHFSRRFQSSVIRYSNCWEDADVLLEAMAVKEEGKYLSIASAGDNALSILSRNPSLVLAVDSNPSQIACIELRKVIFENLSYKEVLEFLGINNGLDRVYFYKRIRSLLSLETREFWNRHKGFISRGIIHAGKVEKYFRLFGKVILPLIINRKGCDELLEEKDESERIVFYTKELNSWRWRLFFRIFFNRKTLENLDLGRKHVEGNVAEEVMERVKYAITILPTHNNPYLEYIFINNFNNSLPFYLRKENFEKIRKNLDKLMLFKGTLNEALESHEQLKFDGFNLSDIFEYMDYGQYVAGIEQILDSSKKGTRLIYWNNLLTRETPEFLQNRLKSLDEIARNLFLQNRAFFYSSLIIEEVQ